MLDLANKRLFVVFTTVIAMALAACGDPAIENQQRLQAAKNYYAVNNPRAAAIELKNILQVEPNHAEARYRLGLIDLDFGDIAGAQKEFRRALEAGWSEQEVKIGLGRAYISDNAFNKVLDEIVLRENYSNTTKANILGLRAAAQLAQGDLVAANKTLAQGIVLDSNAFQVRKTSVELSLVERDDSAAALKLKDAIAAYPDHRELFWLSAVLALHNDNNSQAIDALQKLLAQEPENYTSMLGRQARLRLATIQILDKQLEQAQTTLSPLFVQFAHDPEVNYLGGMLAFHMQQYRLAEERLLKVLKVIPSHLKTHLLYGALLFQQEKYLQATDYLSRYVNADPENMVARKLLGRVYMVMGQHDQAHDTLKPALEIDARDTELLALVGLSEMRSGNMLTGINNLEKAVQAAPENTGLRNELAIAYISSGAPEKAIEELNAILLKDGRKKTESLLILAHLKAGEQQEAIDIALRALSKQPDDPMAMVLVGNVYAITGNLVEARNYFEKSLNLSPNDPQTNLSMARLEEAEGNVSKAATIYKRLVDNEHNIESSLLGLARLAEKQGNKTEFYNWLEIARRRHPQELKPRLALFEGYLKDRELDKAEEVVKETREIAPNNTLGLAQWGRVLVAQRRYNEALPVIINLVADKPDARFFRILLSEVYLKLGQTQDAIIELKGVLERQPENIGALILMVRSQMQLAQFEQANEFAIQIERVIPDSSIGYELSGDCLVNQGKFYEAKTAYTKAWDHAQSSDLAIKLSTTALRVGKIEEGIDVLRFWLEGHADDVQSQQTLGLLYQDLGKKTEAKNSYKKVLKLHPDNLVALNNLAWLYSQENNPKAKDLAEKAYHINPDSGGVKDTYGWILVKRGEFLKGHSLLKEAYEELYEVSEVRYHYAVSTIRTGDEDKGIEMLKKLLSEDRKFEGSDDAERLLSEISISLYE